MDRSWPPCESAGGDPPGRQHRVWVVGETLSAAIIVSIVLLSVALDFFQSFRSEKAASSLRSLVTLTASVWRDGQLAEVRVRDVVPGDLLQLRAGDLVPADATLLSAVSAA